QLIEDEVGHVLDAVVELRREAQPFNLQGATRDGLGHVADALEIVGDVNRGDDGPQVAGHRLAAGDHGYGGVVDTALHLVDALVGGDVGAGEAVVELEQSANGTADSRLDEAAHLGNRVREVGEFVRVGRDDVFA